MESRVLFGLTLTLSTLVLLPQVAFAQEVDAAQPDAAAMIASALKAAPEAITATATVTDLAGNVLREGTNGFTCMPDDPGVPGDAPICLDAGWQDLISAWMNREEPPVPTEPAFIYALQGGWPTSNVDPYADGPTEDNEWLGITDPHIAVFVPDASMLEGISADPNNGGPWIMWSNTPYAHLMIPAARKQ
jgi:hypothetical protein